MSSFYLLKFLYHTIGIFVSTAFAYVPIKDLCTVRQGAATQQAINRSPGKNG